MSSLPPNAAQAWHAAATGAVLTDADTGILSFSGSDAAAFLQGQLSSDVAGLAAGAGQRSTYNSPKGRVLATLYVGRPGPAPDRYVALASADLAEPIRKRLAMYVLRSKVTLTDESPTLCALGVGGPAARQAVVAALGSAPPPGGVDSDGVTTIAHLPEGRLVIAAPRAAIDALRARLAVHAAPAPADVWTWLGVRAGVPSITAATQDLFVAQTANQDALGALDFRKGCYTGQEIIARSQYLGRLKERLYLLHSTGDAPAPGTRLFASAFGEQACGTIVNSAPDPHGGSVMLGVLQTEAAGGPLALAVPGGQAATIEPLPYALPEPVQPRGRVKI